MLTVPSSRRLALLLLVLTLAALTAGCSALNMEQIAAPTATPTPFIPQATLPPETRTVITFPATYTYTPLITATLAPSSTPLPTSAPLPSVTLPPTLTPTPVPTGTRAPSPTGTLQVWRGDLHMHTTCSDGEDEYNDMAIAANWFDYAFIAITDHHWCPSVIRECQQDERLLCIPGQEVGADTRVEVLAIGIRDPIPYNLTVPELVERIHAQGGLAIAAHPWSNEQTYTQAELLNSGLDAMECPVDNSEPMDFDTSALPCVFDSDAHSAGDLDTEKSFYCIQPVTSFDQLKSAILAGACWH